MRKKQANSIERHPKQYAKQRKDFTAEEVAYYTRTFNEKNKYMSSEFKELTPKEFYRSIFPEGTFEQFNNMSEHKPNGILSILYDEEQGGRSYNRILFDDLGMLDEVAGKEFVIASPIAFSGRTRSSKMAYKIYGITIDLDGIEVENIKALISQMQQGVLPMATHLVNSGTGLHVYYIFDTPVPAMPNYFDSFNNLKKALIDIIWNSYTSSIKERQYQGIFQGYRVPGTQTKISPECIVKAYNVGKNVTVRYLNSFVEKKERADFDDSNYTSLQEAQELWEDWYNRRVVNNEPVGNYKLDEIQKKRRRQWYEGWKNKIIKGALDGNRHYCIGVLFNYAMKAEIPMEEALEYALSIVPTLNALTVTPGNAFTEDDVYAAEIYYDRKFIKMGRKGIIRMTGIDIGETKRNHRPQKEHLEEARAIRDVRMARDGRKWTDGRPDKKEIIEKWRIENPSGTKAECIKATGISKPTVYKWWDSYLYKIKKLRKETDRWDLPKYYVVKEDKDALVKLQEYYSKGITDVEILTEKEVEDINELHKIKRKAEFFEEHKSDERFVNNHEMYTDYYLAWEIYYDK